MTRWFRFKDWSLKWKSFFIFFILVVIPVPVLGVTVLVQINNILKEQAVVSTERILDTLSQNVSSVIQNVEDISSFMIYDEQFRKFLTASNESKENPMEVKSLEDHVNAFSAFHAVSKRYINSIELQGINGVSTSIGEQMEGDESAWKQAAGEAYGGIVWSEAYTMRSLWTGDRKHVISLLRQINDINEISRNIGLVRIRLNEDFIASTISAQGIPRSSGSVFIINRKGVILSHKDKFLLGTYYNDPALLQKVVSNNHYFTYAGSSGGYLAVIRKIERPDWFIVATVEENAISKNLESIRTSVKTMILVSLILGLAALIGFYYFIIRPILELIRLTRQVERGNFNIKVNVLNKDDIGILGMRFNSMLATIRRLIDTKYTLEIKQRESELKALQNQIDPHFLYNTLDMIRWTARMEKASETSRLIEALSRLFRISLSRGKLLIPLSEELNYVRSYLILQEKRLGHGLKYTISMDEKIGDALVLKKILQPIVENSILHGFQGMDQPGLIDIRCCTEDGNICIDVTDNGKGIPPHTIETDISRSTQSGFALRNIRERIALLFGPGYGLQIFSREGEGVRVRITVPIIRSEQELSHFIEKENELHER